MRLGPGGLDRYLAALVSGDLRGSEIRWEGVEISETGNGEFAAWSLETSEGGGLEPVGTGSGPPISARESAGFGVLCTPGPQTPQAVGFRALGFL